VEFYGNADEGAIGAEELVNLFRHGLADRSTEEERHRY
jgi:hypothetical protein